MTEASTTFRLEGTVGHWLTEPVELAVRFVRALGYSVTADDIATTQRESRPSAVTKLVESQHRAIAGGCIIDIAEHERLVETPKMHDSAWGCHITVLLPEGTKLQAQQHGGYDCEGPSEARVREVVGHWLTAAH